jgi:hypothetical protein
LQYSFYKFICNDSSLKVETVAAFLRDKRSSLKALDVARRKESWNSDVLALGVPRSSRLRRR